MSNEKEGIRFDLHSHTINSDGKHTPEQVSQRATEIGLNFLAITDHNFATVMEHKIDDKDGVIVVPGFELTLLQAHVLILGIDQEISNQKLARWNLSPKSLYQYTSYDDIEKMLSWSIDEGACVIVAHPGFPFGVASMPIPQVVDLYEKRLIHGAEVHNYELEKNLNKMKLSLLYKFVHHTNSKVFKANGIPAFFNSDAHSRKHLAGRYNYTNTNEDLNQVNFVAFLKQKNIKIKGGERKIG